MPERRQFVESILSRNDSVVRPIAVFIFRSSKGFNRVSAEDEVIASMNKFIAARLAGDVPTVIDCYSDAWQDNKGYNKNSLREGQQPFAVGMVDDKISIDATQAKVTLDADTATYSPVVIDSEKGRITYEYTLAKEPDQVWRLTFTQNARLGDVPDG